MPERIISLAQEMAKVARGSVSSIQSVTSMTRVLSLNAMIEASRAGDAGKGFAVVAREVRSVSDQISNIAAGLGESLVSRARELDEVGKGLVANVRGTRLTDLALNMIEIIDRNLYERSCDVRWWATDAAVVTAAAESSAASREYATSRLRVILESYTVYRDIWVCDVNGNVLASGRPGLYPTAGRTAAKEPWFRHAIATKSGGEFAVDDIAHSAAHDNNLVATYSAAIREGGRNDGKPLGVLGVFFDWQSQSQTVVDGVRLLEDERKRTRCMILDAKHRIIASSDRTGILSEQFPLMTENRVQGNYASETGIVGFARTPGYETYKGLGWYGVVSQSASPAAAVAA